MRLLSDERGATAIEYGVIMALVFLALVIGVALLGGEVLGLNTHVAEEVENATRQPGG